MFLPTDAITEVRFITALFYRRFDRIPFLIKKFCCFFSDCERGFSTSKRVKTVNRNRLGSDTVNALLLISMEGPTTSNFDFKQCSRRWSAAGSRRLNC